MQNVPGPPKSALQRWLKEAKGWLYPYRPRLRDRRFWVVQGLILVIAGVHTTLEILRVLGHPTAVGNAPQVSLLSFVSVSLFFIPVVYAALNFGLAGSVATALWCSLLTIPNLVLHPGMERVREVLQLGIVDAIAVFVGQRVDREMAARERAEAAGAALSLSEMKYRGLFESSPVPVLVLDPSGLVLEANPAAGALFGTTPGSLNSMNVAELVGKADAGKLLASHQDGKGQGGLLLLWRKDGSEVYLEPTVTQNRAERGEPVLQLLLRDVTEEQHRQAGLRTYAAYVLRAQEEERKRIAQELHDEMVQALVLLCRRLDTVEGAAGALPPSALDELRDARRSAEDAVQGLRDFARALRPPILEDLGLVTSIRRLLMDLAERAHLEGRLKVVGAERRLHPDAELGVFRIAQEALRNIERHAQATHVLVTLTFADQEARAEVRDNGVGFSLPPGTLDFAAHGQLGLLGMRERAEILGGSLEIQSSPGNGTTITVSTPIQARATADVASRRLDLR